jgi:hypothetical protein
MELATPEVVRTIVSSAQRTHRRMQRRGQISPWQSSHATSRANCGAPDALRRLSGLHGKCPVGKDLPGEVCRPDGLRLSRPVSNLLAPPVLTGYREETYQRQLKLGVIPQDAKLTPRPKEIPAWNSRIVARHLRPDVNLGNVNSRAGGSYICSGSWSAPEAQTPNVSPTRAADVSERSYRRREPCPDETTPPACRPPAGPSACSCS